MRVLLSAGCSPTYKVLMAIKTKCNLSYYKLKPQVLLRCFNTSQHSCLAFICDMAVFLHSHILSSSTRLTFSALQLCHHVHAHVREHERVLPLNQAHFCLDKTSTEGRMQSNLVCFISYLYEAFVCFSLRRFCSSVSEALNEDLSFRGNGEKYKVWHCCSHLSMQCSKWSHTWTSLMFCLSCSYLHNLH